MATTYVCPPGALQSFVHGVCSALGSDEEIAAEVAHHLVGANLAGHDSHGVLRLTWYEEQARAGSLLPGARPTVLRDGGATALVDAGRGFGHFSTAFALNEAVARARRHGLAAIAIRHSMHIGRLGEYAERGAVEGLVTIVTYGSAGAPGAIVVPFGGRERFLGTNPWAIGIPAAGGPPMLFDAATSTVAEGKLRVARSKGTSVPPGCVVDQAGEPSTDPNDFYNGGALLPLGGAVAGHKGYSLAMASALIGGLAMIGDDAPPTLPGSGDNRGWITGVVVLALDPEAFGEGETYATMVGETLAAARRIAPAPGVAEVLAPGDPEARTREERGRDGIPLPAAIWQDLTVLAERYNVPLPPGVAS